MIFDIIFKLNFFTVKFNNIFSLINIQAVFYNYFYKKYINFNLKLNIVLLNNIKYINFYIKLNIVLLNKNVLIFT